MSVVARALLLCGLLCAASGAQAQQQCELDGTPVNPASGATTAGKTGLMRCRDADTGALLREQEIQAGAFKGKVRQFLDGRLVREYTLNASGNIDGPARDYGPEGQLLRDSVFDDGTEVGLVRSFHANGQLRRVAFRGAGSIGGAVVDSAEVEFTATGELAGLRCGSTPLLAPAVDDARLCGFVGGPSKVELFDDKGLRLSRMTWLQGKRVSFESLYDNGQPATQEETRGDQRIERRFSSEGVKRSEVVFTLLDRGQVRRSEQEFSETGALLRDRRWNAAGEPVSDKTMYLNGQPRSAATFSGSGAALGAEVTQFHDNGQRAAQGRFLTPARAPRVAVGTHQRFNEAGTLVEEARYDVRGRIQRERRWDDSGALVRDEEVFPDGSRKAHIARP